MVALMVSAIVCYFIQTVIDKFTVKVYMLRNRVWKRAFKRLERLEGKLSRAVLMSHSYCTSYNGLHN